MRRHVTCPYCGKQGTAINYGIPAESLKDIKEIWLTIPSGWALALVREGEEVRQNYVCQSCLDRVAEARDDEG